MITISALFTYPLKSAQGSSLASALITEHGLENDRRLMVVDPATGEFLAKSHRTKLAMTSAQVVGETICIQALGRRHLIIPLHRLWEWPRMVKVYGPTFTAYDRGNKAADWFTEHLGTATRLVAVWEKDMPKKAAYKTANAPQMTLACHDSSPIHLITQPSLGLLASQIAHQEDGSTFYNAATPQRFRPNIMVRGSTPRIEESWKILRIGETLLEVRKATERCYFTAVDPLTGEKGIEPGRTLAEHWRSGPENKPSFGIYLFPLKLGTIKVGDEVVVELSELPA